MEKLQFNSPEGGIEPEYRDFDAKSPDVTEALRAAPLFEKFTLVEASFVEKGDGEVPITTKLQDGTVETTNIARPGDVIVTNRGSGGEQYVTKAETFWSKYDKTDEEGVFAPKGKARAIRNPAGHPIRIQTRVR